jgi:hypothetical protein
MTNIYVPNVDVPLLRHQYEELCELIAQKTDGSSELEGLLYLIEEMLYIAKDELKEYES